MSMLQQLQQKCFEMVIFSQKQDDRVGQGERSGGRAGECTHYVALTSRVRDRKEAVGHRSQLGRIVLFSNPRQCCQQQWQYISISKKMSFQGVNIYGNAQKEFCYSRKKIAANISSTPLSLHWSRVHIYNHSRFWASSISSNSNQNPWCTYRGFTLH